MGLRLGGALLPIVVHALKRGIKARRPPALLAKGEFILIGPRINLYAYHSGHSATVFSLAGALVLRSIHLPWLQTLIGIVYRVRTDSCV